jgi:predicted phage terminase large subunit-like protein
MAIIEELIGKQDLKTINSNKTLIELLDRYLYRDSTPEKISLLNEYKNGAPLTGKLGIRKKLGAIDLEYFGKAYFPHYFSRETPDFHRELDRVWMEGVLKNKYPLSLEEAKIISRLPGCKRGTAAPRGHAKSTNMTFKDTIHTIVYRYKHYPILLSDSSDQAESFLDNIRVEFEENEAIIEDFGDLRGKVWSTGVIITSTDIKVEAIGSGKKIRGRKHRNWRPDLIVLDDIENDDNVRTPEQRKKLENWFYKAVSKAGDDYTDIIYIGTLLHYDSLLAKVLKNPGYKCVKYKAVLSFAINKKLWDQWEAIYIDLTNENHEQDALEFFNQNRAEMLKGTKVLWEAKLPYYDLMVMKVTEGDASFNSEEQNEPINPEDCLFNDEWFDYFNEFAMNFNDKIFKFFGFVDPSLGKNKKSDFSAIITIAKDIVSGYMYVIDADIERRHPDKIITDVLAKEIWLRKTYKRGYTKFGAETNQFQWFLKEELAKASAKEGLYLPIQEVPQTTDKTLRVQTLQPDIKNKYIKFNPKHKLLLEQLRYFPMADHDDGPDGLEGCRTIAKNGGKKGIFNKPKGW